MYLLINRLVWFEDRLRHLFGVIDILQVKQKYIEVLYSLMKMSAPFVWVSAPPFPAFGPLPNNFICLSLISLSFRLSLRAWQVDKFAFVADVRFLVLILNATTERVRCVSIFYFVSGPLSSCHLPPSQIILDEFHWFVFLSGFVWELDKLTSSLLYQNWIELKSFISDLLLFGPFHL